MVITLGGARTYMCEAATELDTGGMPEEVCRRKYAGGSMPEVCRAVLQHFFYSARAELAEGEAKRLSKDESLHQAPC